MAKVLSALYTNNNASVSTLAVRTGPAVGRYLRCTDATTGDAQYSPLGFEQVATTSNNYVIPSSTAASVFLVTPSATATITLPSLDATTYGRLIIIVNLSSTQTLAVTAAGTDRIWDADTPNVTLSGSHSSISLFGGDATNKVWMSL